MYSNKRTPRTTPRRTPAYTPARPSPGRATAVAARRRLNFGISTASAVRSYTSSRLKSRIGYSPGAGTSFRRNTVDKWLDADAIKNSKTLYNDELTAIPRKTGVEVNARERDMVNLLGFTIRLGVRNRATLTTAVIRCAVVSPIDRDNITNVDFFRGYQDKRSQDFASTLDTSQSMASPINRDKYVVLWEKKIELGPEADVTGSNVYFSRNKDNYTLMNCYVPLNRQIRFHGAGSDDCSDKVFLVYWYDEPLAEGSATTKNFVRIQRWCAAHWKES